MTYIVWYSFRLLAGSISVKGPHIDVNNKPVNMRYGLQYSICRVSISKTFAKFFRKETQNFSFFAHQFCAKTQQFAQSFAKVISRKIALLRFCETQVLRNSATRVLRNSAIRCVFLRIQFWKNLVLEYLPIGHFYIIDQ